MTPPNFTDEQLQKMQTYSIGIGLHEDVVRNLIDDLLHARATIAAIAYAWRDLVDPPTMTKTEARWEFHDTVGRILRDAGMEGMGCAKAKPPASGAETPGQERKEGE